MSYKIAVVGLGYVGIPLAEELSKHYDVIGYDVKTVNIPGIETTSDRYKLRNRDVIIVAVPTPIDANTNPNLGAVLNACHDIGQVLTPGTIICFESTVAPGTTTGECVSAIENASMTFNGPFFKWKKDFNVGFSPERINPGDKVNLVTNITKLVSGDTPKTLKVLSEIYSKITNVYECESIEIAEAAKIMENVQRDVNIGIMNEFQKIFDLLQIDVNKVIDAASTKWNFAEYRPGLVGGHCIGVDPYYIISKAKKHGYSPKLFETARELNNSMSDYKVNKIIKELIKSDFNFKKDSILFMGITFKPNVADTRNSKAIDVLKKLKEYSDNIDVYDPIADGYHGLEMTGNVDYKSYDIIIVGTHHSIFNDIIKEIPNDNICNV